MSIIASFLLAAAASVTVGDARDWENPAVNSRNRLPARTWSVPLASVEDALTPELEPTTPYFLSLNGEWKFSWAGNPELRAKGFEGTDYDDSKWGTIDVPSCVELRGWGTPGYTNTKYPTIDTTNPTKPDFARILDRQTRAADYNPVSSYRRHFQLPEAFKGRRTILRFEGVGSAYYIWVNGQLAGYAEDSKLASEFDITPMVKDGDNLLAVEVYKWCDGSLLEDQDMFRFSGIFRDVSMLSVPLEDSIWDFRVRTSVVRESDYTGDWRLELESEPGVSATLYDSARQVIGQLGVEKSGDDSRQLSAITVKAPALWSAEHPSLYTLVLQRGSDIRMRRVGFKEQKIVGSTFLVNGKAIKFHGVNRHETNPDNGRTVTLGDMMKDIALMKLYNIDTVRTCHYPDHRLWYDLCDRYGIYLVAEANVEGHEPMYDVNAIGRFPEWEHTIVERNERHVTNFRNHPAITLWSLGNETGHGDCFRQAIKRVRELDSTRPIHWERGNPDVDVDSTMYPAVEWLEQRGRFGDGEEVEGFKWQDRYPGGSDHTKGKCFFLCEYAHAMGNSMGNFQEYWDAFYAHPSLAGGCIWDWVDQAVWKYTSELDPDTGRRVRYLAYGGDWDENPTSGPFCDNGVVNPLREVSPKLLEVAHVHRPFEILKREDGSLELVNRRGFTTPDAFDCQWEYFVEGKLVKSGKLELPAVPPLSRAPLAFHPEDHMLCNATVDGVPESWFNFTIRTRRAEGLVPAGWTVSRNQICYSEPLAKPMVADGGEEVVIEQDARTVTVGCGRTTAVFCRKSGTLCNLIMNGVNVLRDPAPGIVAGPLLTCERAFTDNDKWMLRKFRDGGLTHLSYHAEPIELVSNGVRIVTRVTGRKSGGFLQEATWRFAKDGSIFVENRVTPFGTMPALPRLGLSMRLDQSLEQMEYFGRGPHENYIDRCTSSFLGVWKSTVSEQYVDYVRPQDNGSKSGVRWVEFTQKGGRGVRFEASEPMFVQALHCTMDDLMFARHQSGEIRTYRPVPVRPEVYLTLDVRQMGLGGNSCGPLPMKQYRFDQHQSVGWTLAIRPVKP